MERGKKTGAIILAGGLSTRMGNHEKSLLELGDKPLIGHVIDRVIQQCDHTAINANGDPCRFDQFNLPVIADTVEGYAGPLAGLLAAMQWYAKSHPKVSHILTVAGDTPFFPKNLRARLEDALSPETNALSLAYSDGQRHPTFGLWPITLLDDLHQFLAVEGNRKIMLFVERYPVSKVDFSFAAYNVNNLDPFFNVNTPEELAEARQSIEKISHD